MLPGKTKANRLNHSPLPPLNQAQEWPFIPPELQKNDSTRSKEVIKQLSNSYPHS